MNHPYEHLADLVDGTLDEEHLAGVQAHLDACASCREDLAHATAGREAARSLPLSNAPDDLHQRIVAAASGGRGTPTWYRWAGAAAAAAAIIAVAIAIALPNVGEERRDRGEGALSAEAQEDTGGTRATQVAIIVQDKNYDEEGLQELVTASRSVGISSAAETAPLGADADPDAAVRCVRRAVQNRVTGRLTRLIQARFEGREAYLAVYLESLGAGQPDLVSVWVAARDDCSFLSTAFEKL